MEDISARDFQQFLQQEEIRRHQQEEVFRQQQEEISQQRKLLEEQQKVLQDQLEKQRNQAETLEKQEVRQQQLFESILGFSITPTPESNSRHVKLPNFNTSDPELWFNVAEHQLTAAKIRSDDEKFGLIIGALDPKTQIEVRDIILRPPSNFKYDTIKKEIIKRLGVSQDEKMRRLLEREEMGDRKPSQFFRHLQTLAGTNLNDDMLRTLWLDRLPPHVRAILATQKSTPLNETTELADAIMSYGKSTQPRISEISNNDHNTQVNIKIAQLSLSLQEEISTLKQEIASLRLQRSHSRDQTPNHTRQRSKSRTNEHGTDGMCWYHWKYGTNAKKCQKPCTFQSKNATGSH